MDVTTIMVNKSSEIAWADTQWIYDFPTMSDDEKMDALCDAGAGNLCNPIRVVRQEPFRVTQCLSETYFGLMKDVDDIEGSFFIAGHSDSVIVRGMIGLLAAWHPLSPISLGASVLEYLDRCNLQSILSPQRFRVMLLMTNSVHAARRAAEKLSPEK